MELSSFCSLAAGSSLLLKISSTLSNCCLCRQEAVSFRYWDVCGFSGGRQCRPGPRWTNYIEYQTAVSPEKLINNKVVT
jgi:hypothetical protein